MNSTTYICRKPERKSGRRWERESESTHPYRFSLSLSCSLFYSIFSSIKEIPKKFRWMFWELKRIHCWAHHASITWSLIFSPINLMRRIQDKAWFACVLNVRCVCVYLCLWLCVSDNTTASPPSPLFRVFYVSSFSFLSLISISMNLYLYYIYNLYNIYIYILYQQSRECEKIQESIRQTARRSQKCKRSAECQLQVWHCARRVA